MLLCWRRRCTLLWALYILGCGAGEPCARYAEGMDRDACLHDQVLASPPAEVASVISLARRIDDPVVRGAAVFSWVNTHNRELDPKAAEPLCLLLEGRERASCSRKLSSVHLRR